jgi:DNA-binding FrmR family transcriptional regulator
MLDEERSCQEILHQLMAIRSAAHQAGLILVRSHALECMHHPDQSMSAEEIVNSLIGVLAGMPY